MCKISQLGACLAGKSCLVRLITSEYQTKNIIIVKLADAESIGLICDS